MNFLKQTLTLDGNNVCNIIPINRPHEAPIRRLGMNRPELTITPYVQQVKKKYTIQNTNKLHALYVPKYRMIKLVFVNKECLPISL